MQHSAAIHPDSDLTQTTGSLLLCLCKALWVPQQGQSVLEVVQPIDGVVPTLQYTPPVKGWLQVPLPGQQICIQLCT